MRKIVISVLTLLIIFTSVFQSFAATNCFTTVDEIQEYELANEELSFLGAKSLNMLSNNNKEYQDSEIVIKEFNLSGTKLNLVGNIDDIEFNLSGIIYQSLIHDEKLVIDSEDINGNFEVIHNGIFFKVPNDYKFLLDNEIANENVFLLYLKNDDNYYTYEFELSEEFIEELSKLVYEEYDNELASIEHWWTKVYEPVVEDISNDDVIQLNLYSNRVSRTRKISYDDYDYSYEMDVILEMYTRDIFREETTGEVLVFIEDQRVYYNDSIISYNSVLGVTNVDIYIKLDSRNDDVFRRVEWDTYSNYPNPKFAISWGYGYGPVSISYTGDSSEKSGSIAIPASSSIQYKLINVFNKTPTKFPGDSHQVYYSIEETSSYSDEHFITADIYYDVFLVNNKTIVDWDSYTLRGSYY